MLVRRLGSVRALRGVVICNFCVLVYGPNVFDTILTGPYMSTIKRDKSPKGAGKSPIFSMRLAPEFKAQLDEASEQCGVSLGNWLKELARAELRRQGIEPKG